MIRSKKGFTIVELMVAVAIISIAFLILGYLVNSLKLFGSTQNKTQAALVARTYIDLVRSDWAVDDSYTQTVLPRYTPPKDFHYSISVVNAITDKEIHTYTYSSLTPNLVANKDPLRTIIVSVKDAKGALTRLEMQVARPKVR